MDLATTFFLLIGAHFVCDYPLQGDFLAKAKSEGPFRIWHLVGHSWIHGAAVTLITGSLYLGVFELIAHTLIEEAKVRGKTSFGQDQLFHVAAKAGYIIQIWMVAQ